MRNINASNSQPPFDPNRRFVRVNRVRVNGIVEVEFAIGYSDLSGDLLRSGRHVCI